MGRRWISCFGLLGLLICAAASAGTVFEPPAVRLTFDADERIHRPLDIVWDEHGTGYLLCEGSCKVLVLDEAFQIVGEFGGCGEGPGEIGRGVSLEILGDHLYVFQQYRLDIFDTAGEHLGRVNLGRDVQDTEVSARGILGSSRDGDQMLTVFDRDGAVVGEDGPQCRGETWDEKYRNCGTITVFADDGEILVLDRVSAVLNRFIGGQWREKSLGIKSGRVWEEGGAVYKRAAISAVCGLPGKGLALLLYKETENANKQILGLLSPDLAIAKIAEVDKEPSIRRLKFSPRGELRVLDWQAEVRVFPPELLVPYLMGRGEQEPRRTTP